MTLTARYRAAASMLRTSFGQPQPRTRFADGPDWLYLRGRAGAVLAYVGKWRHPGAIAPRTILE
jgi:hypothetical protein